jgi:hypothetical protein
LTLGSIARVLAPGAKAPQRSKLPSPVGLGDSLREAATSDHSSQATDWNSPRLSAARSQSAAADLETARSGTVPLAGKLTSVTTPPASTSVRSTPAASSGMEVDAPAVRNDRRGHDLATSWRPEMDAARAILPVIRIVLITSDCLRDVPPIAVPAPVGITIAGADHRAPCRKNRRTGESCAAEGFLQKVAARH